MYESAAEEVAARSIRARFAGEGSINKHRLPVWNKSPISLALY